VQDAHHDRLGRALQQMLLASYGLYAEDLVREVTDAVRHVGGEEVILLLADYDQRMLLGFEEADDRTFPIEGAGPGLAFRQEIAVEELLPAGRRRTWLPVKDSADRLGVLGVVDRRTVPPRQWEAIASLVGELIVSKSQYGDHITARRRRSPFSVAAEMRWALLPPLTFTSPDVTIAGFVQPSHGIAGDAFDYSVDGRTASVAIFDAMGHGIEASRIANVAIGGSRNARRAGLEPRDNLVAVDELISSQFGQFRFVTAQVGKFDLDSGSMVIANAGHPPPLHLRPGRPAEVVDIAPARPAGLGTEPTSTVIQLDPGDALVFRTDGIAESRSPEGEFFGEDRLAPLIVAADADPPAEIVRRCLHAVVDHQRGRPSDDATLLLLRWSADARTITCD
jgi:Stage II sporulation protein E (SpoIIE)